MWRNLEMRHVGKAGEKARNRNSSAVIASIGDRKDSLIE